MIPEQEPSGISTWRRLRDNSLAVLGVDGVGRIAGFVSLLLLGRFIDPEVFGRLAYAWALLEVARVLCSWGIPMALLRRLGGKRSPSEEVGGALAFGLSASFVAYGFIAAASAFDLVLSYQKLLLVGGVGLFAHAFQQAMVPAFKAAGRMPRLFKWFAMQGIVSVAVVLAGILASWQAWQFLASSVSVDVFLAGVVAIIYCRDWDIESPSWGTLRGLMREALPIGAVSVLAMAYFRVDVFFVEHWRGAMAVGDYALAYRGSEALLIGGVAITASALPHFSRLIEDGRTGEAETAYSRLVSASTAPLLVAVSCAVIAANLLVPVLFPGHPTTARLFSLLVWSIPFMYLNMQTTDLLFARKQAGVVALVAAANLGLNVALNAWLVPDWGARGAAATTVVTEGLNSLMQIGVLAAGAQALGAWIGWGVMALAALAVIVWQSYLVVALAIGLAVLSAAWHLWPTDTPLEARLHRVSRLVSRMGWFRAMPYIALLLHRFLRAVARAGYSYVRDWTPRCVVRYAGVRVRAARMFDRWVGGYPWHRPQYEAGLLAGVCSSVSQGDNVVIVGGGWGVSGVVAAQKAGGAGSVHIFEAAAERVEYVRDTVSRNAVPCSVRVHHGLVGQPRSVWGEPGETPIVAPKHLPPVDVLVLDCEGAEADILPSLQRRPRVIVVETHGLYDAPPVLIERQLLGLGYRVVDEMVAEPSLAAFCRRHGVHVLVATRQTAGAAA